MQRAVYVLWQGKLGLSEMASTAVSEAKHTLLLHTAHI
jgi:hypothetical protein